MSKRQIEVIDTRDGNRTIAVNKILLHSKYNPYEEARRWAESVKQDIEGKKYIVLYGLGFGYHVSAMNGYMDDDATLVVVDIDKEVIDEAQKSGAAEKVNLLPNVKIRLPQDEREFFEIFTKELSKADAFMIYRPSLKVLPEEYSRFKEVINDYYESTVVMKKFQKDIDYNIVNNEQIDCEPISAFFQRYSFKNQAIAVVASGPSLKGSLDELKKARDKVKIFCVGSALRPLMLGGIKPDMICILDPQEMVYEQIRGYEDLDVPMCFLYTASHKTVSSYFGPKYIFYNCAKEGNQVIQIGNSVATAVLSIAIEGGANKILFVGQDLAYINNKTHTADTIYGEAVCYENQTNNHTVVGINGEMLKTSSGLLNFKRWIERKISYTRNVKFINCSKGAKIHGTIEMEIEQALADNNILGGDR